MNREDIICMAREAGFDYSGAELAWESVICTEELERFATLVAQLERERIAKKIEQLPFGDTAASFGVYVRENA
jgi:hypothetical protein